MGKNGQKRGLLRVHLSVLLFGLSGLFGKLLGHHSLVIAWGRTVFSSLTLACVLAAGGQGFRPANRRDLPAFWALGALLAFHWSSFYQAIRLSTVALGLISFSTFPIFLTFLEPLFTGKRPGRRDLALALCSFGGVVLATPFSASAGMLRGVLWGCASGLSYALLGLCNQRWASRLPAAKISFYEQLFAAVSLTPCLLWLRPAFSLRDLGLLAVLGSVFTALSHTLFISGLKTVRAQAAGVISTLEPVYGILFAALLIGEIPGWRQALGGLMVLACAAVSSLTGES